MADRLGWFGTDVSSFENPDGPQILREESVWDAFQKTSFYDRESINHQLGLNGIDHQRQFEEQLRAVNRPGVYFFPEKIDDGLFVMRKEVKEGLATSLQTMYTLQMQTTIECPSVRDLMTARMTNFYFHLTEAYERLARIEEMQWAALEAEQDTAAPDGNK